MCASSLVEVPGRVDGLPSKLATRVRFPSPARGSDQPRLRPLPIVEGAGAARWLPVWRDHGGESRDGSPARTTVSPPSRHAASSRSAGRRVPPAPGQVEVAPAQCDQLTPAKTDHRGGQHEHAKACRRQLGQSEHLAHRRRRPLRGWYLPAPFTRHGLRLIRPSTAALCMLAAAKLSRFGPPTEPSCNREQLEVGALNAAKRTLGTSS